MSFLDAMNRDTAGSGTQSAIPYMHRLREFITTHLARQVGERKECRKIDLPEFAFHANISGDPSRLNIDFRFGDSQVYYHYVSVCHNLSGFNDGYDGTDEHTMVLTKYASEITLDVITRTAADRVINMYLTDMNKTTPINEAQTLPESTHERLYDQVTTALTLRGRTALAGCAIVAQEIDQSLCDLDLVVNDQAKGKWAPGLIRVQTATMRANKLTDEKVTQIQEALQTIHSIVHG